MSTVMYVYRISPDTFWDTIDTINAWYKENNIVYLLLNKRIEAGADLSECYDSIDELFSSGECVSLQVFTIDGNYYIRVLERGYLFMNNHEKFDVVPVFYDNRVDMTDEMIQHLPISEKIDELIANKHYLMYPLVDKQGVNNYLFSIK